MFKKCTTIEELKKEYNKMVFKLHPDVSGYDSTIDFQNMQNEFEKYHALLKDTHKNVKGETYKKETSETAKEYMDLINKLLAMGLEVEVVGCFIWVGGNTKPHKEELKALGLKWSKHKAKWYKAPKGYKRVTKKNFTYDEIKQMFGSEKMENNTVRLEA